MGTTCHVLVLLVATSTGLAAAQSIDGCPPVERPRPHTFGISPNSDAILGPSNASLITSAQQLRYAGADLKRSEKPSSAWIREERVSIRAHLDNGLGLGVAHSWFTGGTEYDARGNVEVSVAYRRTWLELGLVRVGVGGQIGEGLATEETDDAPALQQLQNLALRMPFHEGEIAPRTPFQASVEARIELVGCHVPFLHVKAGFLHWKVFDIHAYSVPLSLTLGGFYRPWFGVGASVEVDLRTPDELFEARRVTRVAALADFWPCRGFHILVNAAALSGELTGVELGVTLSVVRSHWSEGE